MRCSPCCETSDVSTVISQQEHRDPNQPVSNEHRNQYRSKFSFRTNTTTASVSPFSPNLTSNNIHPNFHTAPLPNLQHFTAPDSQVDRYSKDLKAENLDAEERMLMQEDRRLQEFRLYQIAPLEKEIQWYENELRIRSNEITELENLLQLRLAQQNSKHKAFANLGTNSQGQVSYTFIQQPIIAEQRFN